MRLVLQKVAWRVNYFWGLFWGVLGGGRIRVMADMKLIIPKFVGSMSRAGATAGDYSVSDIRNLQRALKAIDPKLRTQLLREAKAPARPVQQQVVQAIQKVTPISGLTQGRLNWNGSVDSKGKTHKPTNVKIQFRTSSSGKSDKTTLVRVRAASPAVTFVDMAGRSGKYLNAGYRGTGRTRPYLWRSPSGEIQQRTHRVNGQIGGIFKEYGRKASRFIWPAAEQSIPEARNQVDKVLQKFIDIVNRKGI